MTPRQALAVTGLLVVAAAAAPQVWAFTTAAVKTSPNGGYRIVAATPSAGQQPFLYCTATDVSLTAPNARNATVTGTIDVNCSNGLTASALPLSIDYSVSGPANAIYPSFSPNAPISVTLPGGSYKVTSIQVVVDKDTDIGTYTVAYTVDTTSSATIAVTGVTFQSKVVVQ
jgi:hypothetical protein